MSGMFRDEPRRGSMPYASDLARVYQEVDAHAPERRSGGYGNYFAFAAGGAPVSEPLEHVAFRARLTGAPVGKAYPWVAALEDPASGYFTDDPLGPSGDSTTIPAYETSGATTDYTSGGINQVYVWLVLSRTGAFYQFEAPATSVAAGTSPTYSECVAVATSNVASLSGTTTIDGVSLGVGAKVLLTTQTTGHENGPWVVQSSTWTRPSEYASGANIAAGFFATIASGTVYAGTIWVLTANVAAVDTGSSTWTYPIAGASNLGALTTGTQVIPSGEKQFQGAVAFNINQANDTKATFYNNNGSGGHAFLMIDSEASPHLGTVRLGVNCRFTFCGGESWANAAPASSDWNIYSDGLILHIKPGIAPTEPYESAYFVDGGSNNCTLYVLGQYACRSAVGVTGTSGGGDTVTGGIITALGSGGAPSGPAGGSLAGTYPNPTLGTGVVAAAQIANSLKPSGTAATTDEALRALGTTGSTACAGNDARLSDTRTPTDASVTTAKLASSIDLNS